MPDPYPEPKRILFLFSDTGGGHRSAAEAVIEALNQEYGGLITTEMVDFFKDYTPHPLNHAPEWYPYMVRVPDLWSVSYQLSNGHRRTRAAFNVSYPIAHRSMRRLVAEHPADVVVSVHPMVTAHLLRAMGKDRPPFFTVVTDLVTTHASWYVPQVDLCIVPTEAARQRALKNHMPDEKVRVVGLPVADRFCQPPADRLVLRQQLGWPTYQPMVMLVGGGEGMGPLAKTAEAIAAARLPASLAIITGRNVKLKTSLEAVRWPMKTFIYGFVRNMPDMMNAADILVTKAGPGTICEALNAGLPMVLYSRLPGQEEGNITYVAGEGAGVWAPTPDKIVSALRTWLDNPEQLRQVSANCRKASRPQAARQIAHILAQAAGLKS